MLNLIALLVAVPFTLAPQSKLLLHGDSNLHEWDCTDPLTRSSVEIDKTSPTLVRSLTLQMAVAGIECGNDTMNGKLRDALDAEKHPTIEYRFGSADRIPSDGVKLKTLGTLTVAGVPRGVTFTVDASTEADGSVIAMGTIPLMMHEVGIEPPTAMLGLMKTADRVTIKFELRAVPAAATVPHA